MTKEMTLEDEVQEYMRRALEYAYDDKAENIDEEHYIKDTDGSNYLIDIAIPKRNVAIECKGPKHKVKMAIGQCITYEVDGWSAYVCAPDSNIDFTTVKRCMRAGVGLVGVDLNKYPTQYRGEVPHVSVYIQRRSSLKLSSRAFGSIEDTVKINEILDILNIRDMDDVETLRKNLYEADKSISIPKKNRWKDIRTNSDILPET